MQVEAWACSQNFTAASFLLWSSLAEDDREEMTWLCSLFTLYALLFSEASEGRFSAGV